MLEDKWERKQLNDPSVSHDIAYKVTIHIIYVATSRVEDPGVWSDPTHILRK